MAILLPPVLAPIAAAEIGYSESETGIFMAIVSISGVISAILSGTLLYRIGPVHLVQLSVLLAAGGLVLLALGNVWVVVPAAVLIGIGYGAITPACSDILFFISPLSHRSMIFSINQIGVPLGGVLAGTLLPTMSLLFGWRVSAILVAGCGVVLALVLLTLQGHKYSDTNGKEKIGKGKTLAGIRQVFGVTLLRRMILPSISFAIIQLCVGTFLVSYLTLDIGFKLAEAGGVLAAAQGAGIVGRVLWGWLADQIQNSWRILPVIGIIMSAATFLVAALLPSWPHELVFLVAIIQGATAIGWNGVYLAEVARLAPVGEAGSVTGGALALTIMGSMFGPPLFTFIVAVSGSYPLAFDVIAVLALISGLSILWPLNHREKA
jgi:MFS family permease